MHPNPAFRKQDVATNLAFAAERGFGTLAVNADPAPLLSHVPFLMTEDGSAAELHLVRSNPIARAGEAEAVLSVTGPEGYVSPDWYGIEDQVPTWNYVAVHLRGRLLPLSQDRLREILARISARFEADLAPKKPWVMDKMSDGVAARMMRQIQPFRLEIASVAGTWKLGQNKDDAVRLRAAAALAARAPDLARLMRTPPKDAG